MLLSSKSSRILHQASPKLGVEQKKYTGGAPPTLSGAPNDAAMLVVYFAMQTTSKNTEI